MSRIVIRGGIVLDQGGERARDVAIAGASSSRWPPRSTAAADDVVLDAAGCIVTPGFVDLHVHLREPGREEAETIETGSRARRSAASPRSSRCRTPSRRTTPCRRSSSCAGRRAPPACATWRRPDASPSGAPATTLAPLGELAAAGVRLFTDDGNGVQDPGLMRRALEYARPLGITLAQHCEVASLTKGAVMHEGSCCSHLGLPGWPALAEELMVHRDIELSPADRRTDPLPPPLDGAAASSWCALRRPTALRVTAEAAPHHFTLTDEMLRSFDAVYKVNPPLRTATDIAAIKAGLADGTIDAIATDHAPHPPEAKEAPLDQAPPGMLGLETALALALTELDMPLADVVAALSWKPAAIAGLAARHGRPIEVGAPANLTVFDPDEEWTVVPAKLASLSRNTPYAGRVVRGKVRHTIFDGAAVVVDGVARR